MDDDEADLREQIFHNNVREQIVSIETKAIIMSKSKQEDILRATLSQFECNQVYLFLFINLDPSCIVQYIPKYVTFVLVLGVIQARPNDFAKKALADWFSVSSVLCQMA